MRHATDEDLDQLEGVLDELRQIPQLRERKRGYFSCRSQAFLHFHEDKGDFYVDVKLDGDFERLKITTAAERDEFLRRVRKEVSA